MTVRMPRRLANAALMGLLGVVIVVLACPVVAADAADPVGADITGMGVPSSARPGDRVVVESSGWPAGAQVQGAVCGDLGIGGSKACRLSGATLGRASAEGQVRLEVVVAKPPRPCPCVVRITSFSSVAASFDAPLNVIGHPVGTPPVPATPSAQMEVGAVKVTNGGAGRWFGLGSEATLAVSVRNTGTIRAAVPPLRYGFGVGDVTPEETYRSGAIVPAKQMRTIEIPVEVPAGFGGAFQAVVQTDEAAALSSVRWTSRPWALFGLFVAMVLLVTVVVRTPARRPRTGPGGAGNPATHRTGGAASAYPLPDVVFVEEIGGVLINPRMLRRSRLLNKVGGRISVEDLMRLASAGAPTHRASEPAPVPDSAVFTEIAPANNRQAPAKSDMI